MRIARTAPALLIVVAAACGTATPTEPATVQPRYDGGNTIGSGYATGDSLVVAQGGNMIGSGSMLAPGGPLFDGGPTIGSGSSVGDSLGVGGDSIVVVQGGPTIGSGY